VVRRTAIGVVLGVSILTAARHVAGPSPEDTVNALAAKWFRASTTRFPETATEDTGWMAPLNAKIFDNSPAALARWKVYEDTILASLRQIDTVAIAGTPASITYGILKHDVESDIGMRVCRNELWNISSYVTGWQQIFSDVAVDQRIGTPARRNAALARARALPRFIGNEITNLREGMRLGYTAPDVVVQNVMRQLDDLSRGAPESSPFYSPAQRDTAKAAAQFRKDLATVIANEINPAVRRYREYLATDYLPHTRKTLGVSQNPNGKDCYRAATRYYSTLDISADSVFNLGANEMRKLDSAMHVIARHDFGTDDLHALLTQFKTDPKYTFRSRQAVIDTSQAAIDRMNALLPKWFGLLPPFPVVIQPYPEFRQRAGAPGQLSAGALNDRPSIFLINTWDPEHKSRADIEATAFHETVPGHHLQISIAKTKSDLHPYVQRFFNSGFGEGWALYAERLADEMGAYSSPMTRMGMLGSQAFRAARCLIDAGIHTRGWTRQQAIDTLAAHTTMSRNIVEGEVDRYISWPGQAPSYMIGRTEILALRSMAKQELGDRFDIRQFHDRVLENGTVTLPMLRNNITRWVSDR
jgi:uncharacterized protein (DUF885 family)